MKKSLAPWPPNRKLARSRAMLARQGSRSGAYEAYGHEDRALRVGLGPLSSAAPLH